ELAIEIGIVLDHEETQDQCSPLLAPAPVRSSRIGHGGRLLCHYIRRGGRLRKGGKGGLRAAAAVGGRRQSAPFERLTSRRGGRPMKPSISPHAEHDCVRKSRHLSVLLNALRTW